jgi:hypothetical protein
MYLLALLIVNSSHLRCSIIFSRFDPGKSANKSANKRSAYFLLITQSKLPDATPGLDKSLSNVGVSCMGAQWRLYRTVSLSFL